MPGRLRSRAVAPRLSRPAACFEHLIFANENRCNHQHEFLSNPAYRKFSGDCAWNPSMGRLGQRQALDIYDEISKDKIATPGVAGAITDDRAEPRATEMPSQGARVGAGRDRAT